MFPKNNTEKLIPSISFIRDAFLLQWISIQRILGDIMAKALRAAIRALVYELCVFGVIYYGLIVFGAMTKTVNLWGFLVFIVILFFAQWYYFYRKQNSN